MHNSSIELSGKDCTKANYLSKSVNCSSSNLIFIFDESAPFGL